MHVFKSTLRQTVTNLQAKEDFPVTHFALWNLIWQNRKWHWSQACEILNICHRGRKQELQGSDFSRLQLLFSMYSATNDGFRPRDTLSAQSWRVNCGGKKIENLKFVRSFGHRSVNICQRAMKYMPNRRKFSQLQWNWRIFSRTSYGFWATPHIRAACWGENCSKIGFLSISSTNFHMLPMSKC